MRILVTGASGWVGTPVVKDLIGHGHQVLGLARSDAAAKAILDAGARVHRGNVEDLASLRAAAAEVDGVVHLAFNHDFSRFAQNAENDARGIRAMAETLGRRPLVVTSGVAILPSGDLALETMSVPRVSTNPRAATERMMEEMNAEGANVSVVRLPPTVHGPGDHGFVATLVKIARETGRSAYVGDGSNHWAAVPRFDVAPVYRLALARGVAGARYHAVAEEGLPFKMIADEIARGLGVPAVSLTAEEATRHFGWLAHFAGFDCRASSAWTREILGWEPTGLKLLQDLPTYF